MAKLYSLCEHHLLPLGKCHVRTFQGYRPEQGPKTVLAQLGAAEPSADAVREQKLAPLGVVMDICDARRGDNSFA